MSSRLSSQQRVSQTEAVAPPRCGLGCKIDLNTAEDTDEDGWKQ